ncbi:MAG: flagellar biosynthetic protein FliO [Gammaproteobacteria bacterium]|nr:MAG: flagellar biosynthetic protein FliO [Gammaproteobacteria bacterium]
MRLSFPILMLFAGRAMAAAEPTPPAVGVGGEQLLQTAAGLAAVLAVLLGLAWVFKRYLAVPGVGKGRVQVIGGVSLGPRERAVIVEVEGERLLLGVAQGNVRMLHRLSPSEASAQDFAGRLAEVGDAQDVTAERKG